MDQT